MVINTHPHSITTMLRGVCRRTLLPLSDALVYVSQQALVQSLNIKHVKINSQRSNLDHWAILLTNLFFISILLKEISFIFRQSWVYTEQSRQGCVAGVQGVHLRQHDQQDPMVLLEEGGRLQNEAHHHNRGPCDKVTQRTQSRSTSFVPILRWKDF